MEPIQFVKQSWPEATCEPSYSGFGFSIWNSPEVGVPSAELLGQGETEDLAWMDAKKNIETYGIPEKVGGAPHYYPLDRKDWGPLTKEKVSPTYNFVNVTKDAFVFGIKDFFSPLVLIWKKVSGK